jgi:PHD/YefM family antitoxin component YafN of YafNO toxin-antitoxin module
MTHVLTSRQLVHDFKSAKRAAASGPVLVTARGRPEFALLSYAEYRRLAAGEQKTSLLELMDSLPRTDGVAFDIPKISIGLKALEFDDEQ